MPSHTRTDRSFSIHKVTVTTAVVNEHRQVKLICKELDKSDKPEVVITDEFPVDQLHKIDDFLDEINVHQELSSRFTCA